MLQQFFVVFADQYSAKFRPQKYRIIRVAETVARRRQIDKIYRFDIDLTSTSEASAVARVTSQLVTSIPAHSRRITPADEAARVFDAQTDDMITRVIPRPVIVIID